MDILWLADDIAVLAENEEKLRRTLAEMDTILGNMKINKTKTKILVTSRHQMHTHVMLSGKGLYNVEEFTYFRSKRQLEVE